MKKNLLIPGMLILIAVLAACQSNSVNTYSNRHKSMSPTIVSQRNFITDNYLADRLQVMDINKSATNDGLLKIQVNMKNTRTGWFSSNNPYTCVYRFSWLDKDGMTVDIPDESRWQEIKVIPGDDIWIKSIAPDKKCKDFVLRIKALK